MQLQTGVVSFLITKKREERQLNIINEIEPPCSEDIYLWILNAVEKKVEDYHFHTLLLGTKRHLDNILLKIEYSAKWAS